MAATGTLVNLDELARDLARRLELSEHEAERILLEVCEVLKDTLARGRPVALGDILTISIDGAAELREDESGGFSAYAPRARGIAAEPLGALKTALDKSCQAAIYYVARGEGTFEELLADHFGRRGWKLVHTRNGMEVLSRMERFPPVALVYESTAEGWREAVRELKCNPSTNWIPVVGICPEGSEHDVVRCLTVQPDELIYEPFQFSDFIQTAGTELAERVTGPRHDIVELTVHLPGTESCRRDACHMVEEILYRAGHPEDFCRSVAGATSEALDNALRHGHLYVECCTIELRLILDHRRLVLAVRDTGQGFDHAAALSAVRGRVRMSNDPLARAAAALKTRRGKAGDGGIARMLRLVDRVDYNRTGNEVVLTKFLPNRDADTSTNPGEIAAPA